MTLMTDTQTAVSARWVCAAPYDLMQQEGAAHDGHHRLAAADDNDAIRLAAARRAPGQTVDTRAEHDGRVIIFGTFD